MDRKLKNEELDRPELSAFKEMSKNPLILVLDNIRSLNNVGSAFRTADAFAIEAIYLCGITAQPPHREINKTALGATESVEWKYFKNTLEAVKALKENHYQCLAIEQTEGAVPLQEFSVKPNDRLALFFGHEVKGVQQEVVNSCDGAIEIPQFGTKHSLNISVSVGVVLWDILSKIKKW